MKWEFEETRAAADKMDKTLSVFQEDLSAIRAGRANPAILSKVTVDYYGTPTPISQIGTVSVPEARSLVIQPWDTTILGEIEKAILKSDLGLTPNNDGKIIRLNFPPLTEERRKELVKGLSKRSEDAKVAIRAIRRDFIEQVKKQIKSNEATEDDLKNMEAELQKLTDKKIKDVDEITVKKEKELLEV